ncbi:MAG: type I restriction endonuclease subunit M [Candidatus Hydrogenedentes bacterium]|nr:type I restriction endonuclease subunit M [Candidatus Hydrogenedentota bacterium]
MDCITRPYRSEPRFELGQIVATRGALEACSNILMQKSLARHLTGDWGCICEDDKHANEEALIEGLRILSAYPIDPAKPCEGFGENTLWIITEADRSVTTFLLPEEY